jgi:hypothetical protein
MHNAISTTIYSTTGISAGNLPSSIDYQISSNMATATNGYARLDLTSGDITSLIGHPRAVLQAYVDHTATPPFAANINSIDLGGINGEEITISNGNASALLGVNTITLFQDASVPNSFIELKSVDTNTGTTSLLILGVQQFTLSVASQIAITIANAATDPVVFRRNISLTTLTSGGLSCGVLEKTDINTTPGGSSTLSIADAFKTTINTPSAAGRIFVLPTPTAGTVGYWYAICNKSTSFTIAVHYPAPNIIATIPVAPSATNGGSVAKFAVDNLGITYSRIG